jgi:hypothetical protein
MGDGDRTVEVHLLQFPVGLWGRARQHSDEMQREFALMSMSSSGASAGGERPVPERLVELSRTLRSQYATATSEQERQLQTALEAGQAEIDDVVYVLPPAVADASRQLAALYDEADVHCRQGEHLLTLTTPDDLVVFRRWFLEQVAAQVEGCAPTPWPAYAAQA